MPKIKEFSQLHVVFADALVAFVYISSVWLVSNGYQPISDVATAIITVYGSFATVGYFTLCGVRNCSRNKLEAVKSQAEGE